MKHKIEFSTNQVEAMAKFLAEIVRQGVTYEIQNTMVGGWSITLLGGY